MEKILKQLKKIRPAREYTLNSRMAILNSLPIGGVRLSPWRMAVNSFQFSSAVVLASLLLMLVLGGFSTWRFLSPFRLAGVDPVGIRAEAEAIDAQLQLTDVTYAAEAAPSEEARQRAEDMGIPTSSDEVTIEEALDLLSE